ncbi:protein-tyrosine kinase 6 [Ambystoma mexicanum]|uniref:protein-tyrosine kinase 6 n=1 Tax=Ambystoma mexicanum TaxID=8296 RepID=UPI0037E7ABF0
MPRYRRYCACCWARCSEDDKKPSIVIVNPSTLSNVEQSRASTPTPAPTPTPARTLNHGTGQLHVSLWDFEARTEEEVSFEVGDLFQVLDATGEWWRAKKVESCGRRCNEIGYVPRNYLAEQETGDDQPWLFGELSRTEATNMLMAPENTRGTFLVRSREKEGFEYALSVRDEKSVRHFRILQNAQRMFHVNSMSFFADLESLIQHYKEISLISGLRLTKPCTKQEPAINDLSEDIIDVWERPQEEFTLGAVLGSGNFGDVYEGTWTSGRVPVKVAIKMIRAGTMQKNEFRTETQFMKTLQHRHLLTLYAICSQRDPFYIITELMPKGDLLKLLRGSEGQKLPPSDLLDMANQVVDGMAYLESKNYIHRDLAARNILVGKDNLCKVADFGMARMIKEDFYLSHGRNVPYRWTAPEALSHGQFSTKTDVWSFGVLLFEIMTRGQIPYVGISHAEILDEILRGYRMPKPRECTDKVYNVMHSCWDIDPNNRPTFATLKKRLENLIFYEETEYCT